MTSDANSKSKSPEENLAAFGEDESLFGKKTGLTGNELRYSEEKTSLILNTVSFFLVLIAGGVLFYVWTHQEELQMLFEDHIDRNKQEL
jgi:hypothetical protein